MDSNYLLKQGIKKGHPKEKGEEGIEGMTAKVFGPSCEQGKREKKQVQGVGGGRGRGQRGQGLISRYLWPVTNGVGLGTVVEVRGGKRGGGRAKGEEG